MGIAIWSTSRLYETIWSLHPNFEGDRFVELNLQRLPRCVMREAFWKFMFEEVVIIAQKCSKVTSSACFGLFLIMPIKTCT